MTIRTFLSALSAFTLAGCTVTLPPAPTSNPADPHAAESASRPLRPMLVASSRTFLSPAADDREEKVKKMDKSKMKPSAMQHEMGRMQDDSMPGMQGMSPGPRASATLSPLPGNSKVTPVSSYYTCAMHPQIKEAKPGNCPICGMTLVEKRGQ